MGRVPEWIVAGCALAALAWQVFTDWPRNGRGRHRKD